MSHDRLIYCVTAWHRMADCLPGLRWEVCIRTFMVSVKYFHSRTEHMENRRGDRDGGMRGNLTAC